MHDTSQLLYFLIDYASRISCKKHYFMNQPTFSHVPYPTDYMDIAVKKVKNHFKDNFKNKKVLDIPAGNGWTGEQLTEYGMEVKLTILYLGINRSGNRFDR